MIPGWTLASMNVKTGHTVVSTGEQKAKQHDSACGVSESPEKVAKPAKLTGRPPRSFPPGHSRGQGEGRRCPLNGLQVTTP